MAAGCSEIVKDYHWIQSDCLSFRDSEHKTTILEHLDSLRKAGEYCDIYLKVEKITYPAHRCVLSSSSQYFRSMFSSGLSESVSKEIELHGFDGERFNDVIQYLYKGCVHIKVDNVETLMMTANMLQLPNLMEACSKFLREQMDTNNCLGFLKFAKLHNCESLTKKCCNFIVQNFMKVIEAEEFELLTLKELIDLLSLEDLRVTSESDVLGAALRWTLCKFELRSPFSRLILEKARLGSIHISVLNNVVEKAFQNAVELAHDISAKERVLCEVSSVRDQQMRTGNIVPRKGCDRYIYIIGGYRSPNNVNWFNGDCLTSVEKLSLQNLSVQSYSIQSMPIPRRCHAVAAMHGCLYVFGGEEDIFVTGSIFCFDPLLNKWKQAGGLLTPSSGLHAVPIGNKIFVIGGCIGADVTSAIDVYNPEDSSMKRVGSLSVGRAFFACSIHEDQIYIAGGLDTYNLTLSCAEKIDPFPLHRTGASRSDKVNVMDIQSMNYARSAFGMVTMRDTIYAFGGQVTADRRSLERNTFSNFIEAYNIKLNTWSTINVESPFRSLSCFCCICHEDKIYIIGGKDEGLNTVGSVWCFNSSFSWTRVASLTLDRCHHVSAIL